MELKELKIFFEILELALTSIAIIIGGIWTYNKFVKKREKFPRASINHRIIERDLDNKKKLVHLFVEIKNIGEVLLSIVCYDIRINKVIPLDNEVGEKILKDEDPVSEDYHKIFWPNLFYRVKNFKENACELEPSEKEEFNFDFIIEKKIHTIQVYSYFKNKHKSNREIGWSRTTFHD
jgi:hypothetical protein